MTNFLLSFGWNWLLVPVAIWFLNGLRKAVLLPRVKYCSHTNTSGGVLARVRRQERLPPWRNLEEEWLLLPHVAVRSSDGYQVASSDAVGTLHGHLEGLAMICRAKDAETEELSK